MTVQRGAAVQAWHPHSVGSVMAWTPQQVRGDGVAEVRVASHREGRSRGRIGARGSMVPRSEAPLSFLGFGATSGQLTMKRLEELDRRWSIDLAIPAMLTIVFAKITMSSS